MKHPYTEGCTCARCTKEKARRAAQGDRDSVRHRFTRIRRTRAPRTSTRRPVPGSAEWAETRGDDIPSLDQPGDDFDTDY